MSRQVQHTYIDLYTVGHQLVETAVGFPVDLEHNLLTAFLSLAVPASAAESHLSPLSTVIASMISLTGSNYTYEEVVNGPNLYQNCSYDCRLSGLGHHGLPLFANHDHVA